MRKLLAFAALGLLYFLGCSDSLAEQLRDGDIIFQTSRSEQSTAFRRQPAHNTAIWESCFSGTGLPTSMKLSIPGACNSLHFKIRLSPPIRPARAGLIRDAEVTEKDILYGESATGSESLWLGEEIPILHKPPAFGKKSFQPR